MTRSLLPHFLFLAFWLAGGSYFFHNSCAHCNEPASAVAPAQKSNMSRSESTKEEKPSISQLQELFYKSSTYQLTPAIKMDLDDFVAAFAENKGDHFFQLEGRYSAKELNVSQYPNLGIARAVMAKNYLASKGLNSSQFAITSKPHNGDLAKGNLSITKVKELPTLNFKDLVNVPIDLYFEGEDLKLTADQKEKLFQISRYLDQHRIGLLKVDGHTDDLLNVLPETKEWSNHMNMANQQAMFVTDLLIENGFPEDRISTNAYSPDLSKKRIKKALAKKKRVTLTLKGKK